MCGIAGFSSFEKDYLTQRKMWDAVLGEMRHILRHRGGDQEGQFLEKQIGLSHSRLSIRDVEGGTQPMVRRQDEKEYVIVYNGELYNVDELKRILPNCVFSTTTDTEVLLYGYMEYGPDFFSQLNGIYAAAIWDGARERLVLVRDRAGVKPLFYTLQNGELIFGSELKALFRHPAVCPEINRESLQEIFGIGPARTSGRGVFKGIKELEPGQFAVFDREGFRTAYYWRLQAREHEENYQDTVARTAFLVRDAVERQMISDVPVCSFLSGGVDSSIVTALAADFLGRQGGRLNTFSFDFTGNDQYFQSNAFQPEQDRAYVEIMLSAHPEMNHTFLECNEECLAQLLDNAVDAKDLPGMADVDASLLYFCRLVKEHNKVALTGECADEIFGGYPWFYRSELAEGEGFPWSKNMDTRGLLLTEEARRALNLEDYALERYRESIHQTPCLPDESGMERRHREISWLNLQWFMRTLLDRMDRTSMYSGLEARVPFADHRIIEYLYNVPWSMKYREGEEKALLRDAFGELLPRALLHRKKSPYPKTYSPVYQKLVTDRFLIMLEDPNAPIRPLIDRERARDFSTAPAQMGRPWFGQLMAGPQLLAYLVQVNTWMERYHISI